MDRPGNIEHGRKNRVDGILQAQALHRLHKLGNEEFERACKAGATRLAEHGCTDHEIMAWGGWSSLKEVQRYTNAANRKRLALQAAAKLKAGTEVANLETRLANQEKRS